MKYIIFIPLCICAVSLIACFILINHILQALSKKEAGKIEKMCNRFLLSVALGALSFSSCIVLDALEKDPHLSIGLIVLKLLGTMAPFAIGGGFAAYEFRQAVKKIKK